MESYKNQILGDLSEWCPLLLLSKTSEECRLPQLSSINLVNRTGEAEHTIVFAVRVSDLVFPTQFRQDVKASVE